MSNTGESDDAELQSRIREAFRMAAVPTAPSSMRDHLHALRTANESGTRRRPRAMSLASFLRGAAIVVVAVVIAGGLLRVSLQGSSASPVPTEAQTASDGVLSGGVFLNGQRVNGDGWRLIGGGTRLRSHQVLNGGLGRVELFVGGAIESAYQLFDLGTRATNVDPKTEALLVVDLLVGTGPVCGQLQFDGVTFDPTARSFSVRYEPGYLAAPLATNTPVQACAAIGVPATLVMAVSLDRLGAGDIVARLQRDTGQGWMTDVIETLRIPGD